MSDAVRAQLDAVEDRLATAQVAHDVEELDRLLHDELAWTDWTGGSGGKAEDLQAHRDEAYTLTRFDVERRDYDVLSDDVAVARVRMVSESTVGDGTVLYTRVWQRTGGSWQVRVAHLGFLPAG